MQWYDSNSYLQSSLYKGKKYTTINVPGASVTGAFHQHGGRHRLLLGRPLWSRPRRTEDWEHYYIFDYPKGSNTGAGGINDSNLIVGSYTPAGKTTPQPYQGTE